MLDANTLRNVMSNDYMLHNMSFISAYDENVWLVCHQFIRCMKNREDFVIDIDDYVSKNCENIRGVLSSRI